MADLMFKIPGLRLGAYGATKADVIGSRGPLVMCSDGVYRFTDECPSPYANVATTPASTSPEAPAAKRPANRGLIALAITGLIGILALSGGKKKRR